MRGGSARGAETSELLAGAGGPGDTLPSHPSGGSLRDDPNHTGFLLVRSSPPHAGRCRDSPVVVPVVGAQNRSAAGTSPKTLPGAHAPHPIRELRPKSGPCRGARPCNATFTPIQKGLGAGCCLPPVLAASPPHGTPMGLPGTARCLRAGENPD